MTENRKEWTLLVDACYVALQSSKFLTSKINLTDVNYDVLLKLARVHKVVPLFYKGINKHPNKSVIPHSFLITLKKLNLNFAVRNLKNAKELLRLNTLFKAANIEIIPYKGVILSEMAYGAIGIRESSDIDILVLKKDLDLIYTILENQNYIPQNKLSSFWYKILLKTQNEYNYDLYDKEVRLFHVEPHWVLGKKMYQTSIDYNCINQFTEDGELLNNKIKKLTPEGLLITTFVHHGASECWSSLKTIIDIAAILQRYENNLDWPRIIIVCKELKIINLLLLGLGLAQKFFNSRLPTIIEELIVQKKIAKLVANHQMKTITKPTKYYFVWQSFSRIIYHFKLRVSWSTKLKVIYYHLLHFLLKPFLAK